MFRSFFMSTTALAGFCIAAAMLPGPSHAAQGPLTAVTPWAVTKIGDASGAGDPYCALARRFTRNTILTFARNKNSEASIALDFQAPKLDPAVPVVVSLDPGDGQVRTYDVTPVSDRALVVRLGRDDDFFSAMNASGSLIFAAGEGPMTFKMADIASGERKLDGCLASIGRKDSGAMADRGGEYDLIEDIESLRADVDSLREENQRLSAMAQKSDAIRGVNLPEVHDEIMESEMNRRAENLMQQNAVLRSRAQQSGIATASAAGAPASGLMRIKSENMRLKESLWALYLPRSNPDSMSRSIAAQAEGEAVAPVRKPPGAESQIFALEEENRRLQQMLAERSGAASGAAQSQARIDDLTAQIEEKDRKLVAMAALTTEVERLKAQNAELEQKLAANAGDQASMQALNNKINALEAENRKLKSDLAQNQALQKENAELKARIQSLKQSSSDSGALTGELDRLRNENADLKKRIAALEGDLKTADDDRRSLRERLASLIGLGGENAKKKSVASLPVPAAEKSVAENLVAAQPQPSAGANLEARQMEQKMLQQSMSAPPAPVSARMSEDPFKPFDKEEMSAQAKEVVPAVSESADAVAAPVSSSRPAAPAGFYAAPVSIPSLVAGAGIAPESEVILVQNVSGKNNLAWQWQTGSIYGSAEQMPMEDIGRFDNLVANYIDKAQKRCNGEFAAEPERSMNFTNARLDAYEIACVGQGVNSAASLLFAGKSGSFNVIAHEAPGEEMSDAMDMRDRIIKAIGTK